MNRDPEKDNKVCGMGPAIRLFKLENETAMEIQCRKMCSEDPDCIAMSGIWGKWCVGCKVKLKSPAYGTKAFIKGMYLQVT